MSIVNGPEQPVIRSNLHETILFPGVILIYDPVRVMIMSTYNSKVVISQCY